MKAVWNAVTLLGFGLLMGGTPAVAGDVLATDLKCEYRVDPLGIDGLHPRLSWVLQSDQRNQKQTAYQILVASSRELLESNEADLWDSGKVDSGQSVHLVYAGRRLEPGHRYHWRVRAWDGAGQVSAWSKPATWSMGLLQPSDWKAHWIAHPQPPAGSGPMPVFRKTVEIAKAVDRAVIYICGLGHHELFVDGKKLGDAMLDPGWTNYRKTCLYTARDTTDRMTPGKHALAVMLGNGFYNVRGGRYTKLKGSFGDPKVILQMYLRYADGTTETIATDNSWKVTEGPIRFCCIFGGEDYDARHEPPGWKLPEFDDSAWGDAAEVEGPGGRLVSQSAPPLGLFERFKPKSVSQPMPGVFVYDMGQNCSAIPRIRVEGKAGDTVRLVPAEQLHANGTVNQAGVGKPTYFQYTLRGNGEEVWCPQFYYTGYQYLQVDSAVPSGEANPSGKPVLLDVESHHIRSSAQTVGDFRCSNELFNRINTLVDWAVRSNLQHVLTDCPHREKLGWLEVSYLMGPSIAYRYRIANLYAKQARDIREAQLEDGMVPCIAPEYTVFSGGFRYTPEWASAAVIDPWIVYRWYGDRQVLEDNYRAMKSYMHYVTSTATNHIAKPGLGDWYDYTPGQPLGAARLTPTTLTATATYYCDVTIMRRVAELLGRPDDAAYYAKLGESIKAVFNTTFYDSQAKQYATGSQTAHAMPLVVGLVESADRQDVLKALVKDVRSRGNQQTAGDVGHRYLLQALAEGGRSDVIFDMTNRTGTGSYGGILQAGWTCMPEAWDARPGASMNHCMLGHIQEWFQQDVGGIQIDPSSVGFKRITVRPQVVGDMTWAKSRHDSMHGRVAVHWQRQSGKLTLQVTIPVNTTATIHVPADDVHGVTESGLPLGQASGVELLRMEDGTAVCRIGSGTYKFVSRASRLN